MSHQSSRDASPPVEAHDCLVNKKKLASQRFFISGHVSLEAEKKLLTSHRPAPKARWRQRPLRLKCLKAILFGFNI